MKHKIGIVCMILGTVLITAALSLFLWNNHENKKADKAVKEILPKLQTVIDEAEKDDKVTNTPTAKVDEYEYIGFLDIPDLNLQLPVMQEWDYKRLKIAPCRFYGSAYTDDLVVAAHNYSRHFGKIGHLKVGSEIYFTDVFGEVICYEVLELETLGGTDTANMISSDYDLTLFTCTYSGESRITVRCERKS